MSCASPLSPGLKVNWPMRDQERLIQPIREQMKGKLSNESASHCCLQSSLTPNSISIFLSLYLYICLSVYLSVSICLSIGLFFCLSVYLSVYPSDYLSNYLAVGLSVYLSNYVFLSINLYFYLSIYLSICLWI